MIARPSKQAEGQLKVFFMPSFVLFAVWIGEGAALIVQGVRRATLPQPARRASGIVLVAAALTLLGVHALPTFAQLRDDASNGGPLDLWRNDLKRGWQAQRFVENGLPLVELGAIIFADWEQATPLWHAQLHMAMRPDVAV